MSFRAFHHPGALSSYLAAEVNIVQFVQSDGNSFYGDVVSDSFDKTSRDEDNILDQTHTYKQMCSYQYYDDFESLYHYKDPKRFTFYTFGLTYTYTLNCS